MNDTDDHNGEPLGAHEPGGPPAEDISRSTKELEDDAGAIEAPESLAFPLSDAQERLLWPTRAREFLVRNAPTIIVFSVVYIVLILLYRPYLMLSVTTTNGGDMGTHHYAAQYLIEELLPNFKMTGWTPQWYAGMPMFTFYMPLPFFFIALLNTLIPYEVAFKLVTASGVFMLPVAAYAFGRLFRFRKPFPLLAAVFSVAFLLMDSFSIYGANILSTLAGEFGYSISFAISFLFLGTLYRGMERSRYDWLFAVNGLILMALVLTHIVTIIAVCIIAPSLLLLHRKRQAFFYMAAVFLLGFCLTAFWGLPFIDKLSWTAHVSWIPLKSFADLLPGEIRLIAAVGVLGMAFAVSKRDKLVIPMLWSTIIIVVLFYTLPAGRLWNGRLLPFFYFTIHLWAAYGATWLIRSFAVLMKDLLALRPTISRKVYPSAVAVALAITSMLGGATAVGWITWNYSGYESKQPWPEYRAMMDYLDYQAPGRVMWEHAPSLDKFGTPRIFELIPYWTDQPTMEGLLMESAFTAPYHFINQAELSLQPSHAIVGVQYPPRNTSDGIAHLQFMNISYMISVSPEVTQELIADPRADFLTQIDICSFFRIAGGEGYVTVMRNRPVRVKTEDWRSTIVPWYKDLNALQVPVLWDRGEPELQQFELIASDQVTSPPVVPIETDGIVLSEQIENERITFETTAIGEPHWIKMSYFPNWRVEGAEGPFVASPSFMMVIPTERVVTLYYGRTWSNNVGQILVVIGILVVVGTLVLDRRRRRRDGYEGPLEL
jgi:hypothetical protein